MADNREIAAPEKCVVLSVGNTKLPAARCTHLSFVHCVQMSKKPTDKRAQFFASIEARE